MPTTNSNGERIRYNNIAAHLIDHSDNCQHVQRIDTKVNELWEDYENRLSTLEIEPPTIHSVKVGQGVVFKKPNTPEKLDNLKRANGNAYRIFTDLDDRNLYSMLWWDFRSQQNDKVSLNQRFSDFNELATHANTVFNEEYVDYPVNVYCYLKTDTAKKIKISEHNSLFSRIKFADLSSETTVIPVDELNTYTWNEIQTYSRSMTLAKFVPLVYQEFIGKLINNKSDFISATQTFHFNKLHKLRNNVPSIHKLGTVGGEMSRNSKINGYYQDRYGFNTVTNNFEVVTFTPTNKYWYFEDKKFVYSEMPNFMNLVAEQKITMNNFKYISGILAVFKCYYFNESNQKCIFFKIYQCGADNFNLLSGVALKPTEKIVMQIDTPQTLPSFHTMKIVGSKSDNFYRIDTEVLKGALCSSFQRHNSLKLTKQDFKFLLLDTATGICSDYSGEFEVDTNNKSRLPFIRRV